MMLLKNKTIISSSNYLKIDEQCVDLEQVSLLLFKVWHENYLKNHPTKNAGVSDYLRSIESVSLVGERLTISPSSK